MAVSTVLSSSILCLMALLFYIHKIARSIIRPTMWWRSSPSELRETMRRIPEQKRRHWFGT